MFVRAGGRPVNGASWFDESVVVAGGRVLYFSLGYSHGICSIDVSKVCDALSGLKCSVS